MKTKLCSPQRAVGLIGFSFGSSIALLAIALIPLVGGCKNQKQSTSLLIAKEQDSAPRDPLVPSYDQGDDISPLVAPLGNTILSLNQFVFPLPGAQPTSQWCVCRGIGTSPHIGLDLARSGSMSSRAVSSGTIINSSFDESCGWAVRLRDANGAEWVYRHLDKPFVKAGDAVAAGRTIGDHISYPKSGCGTGAHLHLERHSASKAVPGDKPHGKSCQFGYRSCNYDPRIVDQMSKTSHPNDGIALHSEGQSAGMEMFEISPIDSRSLGSVSPEPKCLGPGAPAAPRTEQLTKLQADRPLMSVDLNTSTDGFGNTKLEGLRTIWTTAQNDVDGFCGSGKETRKCIAGYTLMVSRDQSHWATAAEATGIALDHVAFDQAAGLCFDPIYAHFKLIVHSTIGKDTAILGSLNQ